MRLIVLPTPHLQTVTSASVNNPTQALIFYGASRFEAPRIGLKFRRRGMSFQILAIRAERTRSLDLRDLGSSPLNVKFFRHRIIESFDKSEGDLPAQRGLREM
jgi:hypothetical protein